MNPTWGRRQHQAVVSRAVATTCTLGPRAAATGRGDDVPAGGRDLWSAPQTHGQSPANRHAAPVQGRRQSKERS